MFWPTQLEIIDVIIHGNMCPPPSILYTFILIVLLFGKSASKYLIKAKVILM